VLLALCAFNSMAVSEVGHTQSQTWLTAVNGFFYGSLSLAFIVNVLIWITTRQSIHGLFVGVIVFSMLSCLSTDHYVQRLVLGSWFEQKRILDLWFFSAMTASAILFAARVLCVRDWNSLVERSVNWIAIALVVLVLPAAMLIQATPILWNLTALIFTVFGIASLIASLRNVYNVRSLKNNLIAFAFLFFVASQCFAMYVMLGLLPEAPINQIVWMLVLITSLTLFQIALVIQLFDTRSNNENKQVVKAPLNHQTDSQAKYTREQEKLHARLMHDFKTPLAIIDSSVQSLTMLEHEEDPQRTLRYNRIRRAVMRINDLLMGSILTEKKMTTNCDQKDA
jgi:hypothetical protein